MTKHQRSIMIHQFKKEEEEEEERIMINKFISSRGV
jgi:hypothetical protein